MFMGLHLECYENESHIVASTLEPLTRPTFSSCQIMECIYDCSFLVAHDDNSGGTVTRIGVQVLL